MVAAQSTQCDSSATRPPPSMPKTQTTEDRMWQKIKSQPLVPIGCATTAYFLFSGIRSFQKRDVVNSQRMMRNRVIAQFVTLICFMGYMGLEQADFRIAPMWQDKAAAEKKGGSKGHSVGLKRKLKLGISSITTYGVHTYPEPHR